MLQFLSVSIGSRRTTGGMASRWSSIERPIRERLNTVTTITRQEATPSDVDRFKPESHGFNRGSTSKTHGTLRGAVRHNRCCRRCIEKRFTNLERIYRQTRFRSRSSRSCLGCWMYPFLCRCSIGRRRRYGDDDCLCNSAVWRNCVWPSGIAHRGLCHCRNRDRQVPPLIEPKEKSLLRQALFLCPFFCFLYAQKFDFLHDFLCCYERMFCSEQTFRF